MAMSTAGRTLILSDTHMRESRRGAGSADALRPLWQGCRRVIFNGDTCETRAQRYRDTARQRLDELRAAADADGVELVLIAGNHDPFVTDRDWLELMDGRIVLTHGDLLHPAIAPWSDEDGVLASLRRQELQREADDRGGSSAQLSLEEKADATKRAAARHWRQQRQDAFEQRDRSWCHRRLRQAKTLGKVLYFWTEMPRRARRFADREFPDCRFFIFGHIHRPGVWIDDDPAFARASADGPDPARRRVILNTGSFHRPCRPRAVVLDDGGVTFWKIHADRKRGHGLADRPLRRFDYDANESA